MSSLITKKEEDNYYNDSNNFFYTMLVKYPYVLIFTFLMIGAIVFLSWKFPI